MKRLIFLLMVILVACGKTYDQSQTVEIGDSEVVGGIHVATGLKAEKGYKLVQTNCTPCHSAKLITQNRASRDGWKSTIAWMQEKQNLWPLGDNEEIILDYLATNYAPEEKGRRENLSNIEWYTLEQ